MKINTSNKRFYLGMTGPTILFFVIMTAYPMMFTLLYSFTDYDYLKGTAPFAGLKNYISLFQNAYFLQAIGNTVKFTILAVIVEVVLGMALAIYVNSLSKRMQKFFRVLVLLPYLLPAVTVALIWCMMLSPNYGVITLTMQSLGLPTANWFHDIHTAFGTILLIDIWQNVPFVFLLLYASLQDVPVSQYEAARIDGAGFWSCFRYVTLPNISAGLSLCIMLRIIDTLRLFEKVNILTGGGPANSTSTITQFMYTYGIKTLRFGFSSACAVVMTVLALVLSVAYIRRLIRK